MTTAPHVQGPGGALSPQEYLAALRQAGPAAVAEALGELGHLLQEIAGDPGTAFDLEGAARDDFSTLLGNLRTCCAALDSLEAHAVIALRDATRRDRHAAARDRAAHERAAEPSRSRTDEEADSATTADISLITRRSPHLAGRTLASAQRLIDVLPRMMEALRTGRISSDVAYAVAGAVSVLDPDLARAVDHELDTRLPELDGAGTRRWRDAVASLAGELDPEGATLRHRRALRERHVTLTPGQNGMATVSARLGAIDARRIHKRLSLEAERQRAAGAREGHGAAMADAFVGTLLGPGDGTAEPGTLDIGLIITDRALFRPDSGDTAHLEGYGPVPVEAVRSQLRAALAEPEDPAADPYGPEGPAVRATIRRLYAHPTVGELVAMDSTAREFPPAMKRFLSWRDTTCRGPYCNAAVRQSDHILPVSRGGPTSLDNGEGLCAHCNKKEMSTASVERVDEPGLPGHHVRWTGHSGISRITSATPLVWTQRPEDEGEAGDEPTDEPTVGPTVGPTVEPTVEPTDEPTDEPAEPQRLTRPRRRTASAPPRPRRRAPRPPGRSEPAATDAAAADRDRRALPSGRRTPRAEPADDPDH